MIGALLARLLGRRTDGDSEAGDGDGGDGGGFAGSLLDASVNYAHGQPDGADATRELQAVSERAGELQAVRDEEQ